MNEKIEIIQKESSTLTKNIPRSIPCQSVIWTNRIEEEKNNLKNNVAIVFVINIKFTVIYRFVFFPQTMLKLNSDWIASETWFVGWPFNCKGEKMITFKIIIEINVKFNPTIS